MQSVIKNNTCLPACQTRQSGSSGRIALAQRSKNSAKRDTKLFALWDSLSGHQPAVLFFALALVIFSVGAVSISAADGPVVVMGEVSYSSLGTNQLEGGPAGFYGGFLEGNLVNSGGVSMLARGRIWEKAKQMREEYNQLNGGRGSYYEKTDAQGNKFWGYEKLEGKMLEPQYRIDAHIGVTRARESDNAALQDIAVTVRIFDIKTGQLVGQTTETRRNADPYANLKELGPKPTWVEKYLTGYTREIKFDDPIREAIDKASKTVVDKLSEVSGQKGESDAERFEKTLAESGYRPIVPDEIRNPRSEESKSNREAPPPGESVSKNDYGHIVGSANCPNWAVLPETGIWCFKQDGEMEAITASEAGLGGIFRNPPTYSFYDGNEPWQAPEKEEAPPEEQPAEDDSSGYNADKAEYEKWLKCYSRPLPQTEGERQEQLRQDMTPGTPCYNPQIKQCKDGSYGLCMEDAPSSGSGWVESR